MNQTSFTQLISTAIHPTVVNWTIRVQNNGGTLPSNTTIFSLHNFYEGLVKQNLLSKMIGVNCFVPDNLVAATTPLISNFGSDPWQNNNFVSSDLSIDGLQGDGASKFLDTGILASSAFPSDSSGGMSLYVMSNNNFTENDMGIWPSGAAMALYVSFGGDLFFDCWNSFGGRVDTFNHIHDSFLGFVTANRTSSIASGIYTANATSSFSQSTGGNAQSSIGNRPNDTISVFKQSGNGVYSSKIFSFSAVHAGLSPEEGRNFFNLVQTMRQQIGGGYA